MRIRLTLAAAAFALAALAAAPSAEAAYRLCVRAWGFEGRMHANVTLSIGGTTFIAGNGGYHNPGSSPMDTCFPDATAHGRATVGWSSPRFDCLGAAVAEGHTAEVWYFVEGMKADPALGGIIPACSRNQ